MKRIGLITLFILVACMTLTLFGCIETPIDSGQVGNDKEAVYDLDDKCFIFESYEVVHKGPNELGDRFSVFSSDTLNFKVRCITSADEISAKLSFYDNKGNLLGTYVSTRSEDVEKGESFVMSVSISENVASNFEVIDVEFKGVAIKRVYMIEEFYHNVTYVYNNGSEPQMIVVESDDYLEPPVTPEKPGYVFDAWFTDPQCTQRFKIYDTPVTDDLVLYAGYIIDYVAMGNRVYETALSATVKIYTKSYSSVLWGMVEVTSHEKQGEGVVIADEAGYYYILTTNDMVSKKSGYENVSYTVVDSYGNTYDANLKHSGESYNLGVLYINKNAEAPLGVVSVAKAQPAVGEKIAVLINMPGGLHYPNFGDVLSYEYVKHKNTGSNAKDTDYDMMVHGAKTDVKITGRPVLDMDLCLVGIQCGTLTDEQVDFENAHVIPWAVIKKYIEAYGI